MKDHTRIIVIGGGIVETDGKGFFCRSQIAEYLEGLGNHYSKVTWTVRLAKGRDYNTSTEGHGFSLDVVNSRNESIFSIPGIIGQLKNYLKFLSSLDSNTDVIVSEYSILSMPYLLLARIFGRRSLYYLGSDPKLTNSFRSHTLYGKTSALLKRVIVPMALMLANGIVVRGKSTYDQCLRWNSNIMLSNPLISYNHFRGILSKKLGEPGKDTFDILYVGKLEENKGVHLLIKSIANVARNISTTPKIHLNIIGSGEMETELRAITHDCDIDHFVSFHGFIDNPEKLADIFSRSDLFVVPTLYAEGFPRVIDEAMACGIPVICSRLGGMKDGLDDSEVVFFTPGSESELSDAIMDIIQNTSTRERYKASSEKKARSILKDTAADQHAMFLERLAN